MTSKQNCMMLRQHSKALRARCPHSGGSFLGTGFSRKAKKHFEPERGFTEAAARMLRQWLEAGKGGVEI